jgi:hypothetical protein
LLALGQGVYTIGNLAVKAVWIPSNYLYKRATAPAKSELSEDDFEIVECEATIVKASKMMELLKTKSYDRNAIYQIVPDEET